MDRVTISIDEIKNNPNLDLSAGIQKFAQSGKWSPEECAELAVASIKREYEYLANTRTNISPRTDAYLETIKNGGSLTRPELFELICSDLQKVATYAKYDELNTKIINNNGITRDDFDSLVSTIGFDQKTADEIRNQFMNEGKIIESYNR